MGREPPKDFFLTNSLLRVKREFVWKSTKLVWNNFDFFPNWNRVFALSSHVFSTRKMYGTTMQQHIRKIKEMHPVFRLILHSFISPRLRRPFPYRTAVEKWNLFWWVTITPASSCVCVKVALPLPKIGTKHTANERFQWIRTSGLTELPRSRKERKMNLIIRRAKLG